MKRSRTSKSKVQFHSDKNSLTALQCLLIGTLHRLYIYVSSRKLRHSIVYYAAIFIATPLFRLG